MQRLCHDGVLIHYPTMTQTPTRTTNTHNPQSSWTVPIVMTMVSACLLILLSPNQNNVRLQVQALDRCLTSRNWRYCAQAP